MKTVVSILTHRGQVLPAPLPPVGGRDGKRWQMAAIQYTAFPARTY
jgi:hypothetical protein